MAAMTTIMVNSRTLGIRVATGAVMDAREWAVTEVSGGGRSSAVYGANGNIYGGGHTASIRSKTANHAELFIRGKDGKEHVVKLKDEDINVRTGNWVSLLSAVPAGHDSGEHVAVMNHDTDRFDFIKSRVNAACSALLTMAAGTVTFIVMALGLLILATTHSIAAWLLIAALPGFLSWRSHLPRKFRTGVYALRGRIDSDRPAASAA